MTDPASTGAEAVLTPPTAEAPLVLTAPEPVAPVAPEKAGGMVPLDQAALPGLDKIVADYAAGVADLDPHSPEFAEKADHIRAMGDDDIKAAAGVSNTLLQQPVHNMGNNGFSEGAKVSATLLDLRRTIEDLDPSNATGVKKLLGMIPFGDKLADYFHRYESAQTHIDAILKALYDGQDELRRDNAALEQEKAHLWEVMQRLAQYIYVAQHLDAALDAKATALDSTDADKAKALRDDVLFYVRQKHQDLLTQLAVSIQGYLAIDVIRKNNLELIRGVDRATTTTISALRTAVIVAQALANQKLVLDQITALNTTTSNLIESTSQLLATQSVDINKQAASATIGLDKLKAAFTNIYQTMDAIDSFKATALTTMATTISTLSDEVARSQTYLSRAGAGQVAPGDEGGSPAGGSPDLTLPSGG